MMADLVLGSGPADDDDDDEAAIDRLGLAQPGVSPPAPIRPSPWICGIRRQG